MNLAETNWDSAKQKNVVSSYILGLRIELKLYYCKMWPLEGSRCEMKAEKKKKNFDPRTPLMSTTFLNPQIQSRTLYRWATKENGKSAKNY